MRMFFAMGGALIFSLVTADGAAAQAYPNSGYEIVTPGRPLGQDRSYVNPTPNGGYEIVTPGRPLGQDRSYANPTPNGGYEVVTPGRPLGQDPGLYQSQVNAHCLRRRGR